MESTLNVELRRLCSAFAEEQDANRLSALLEALLQSLEERELLACLL